VITQNAVGQSIAFLLRLFSAGKMEDEVKPQKAAQIEKG